MAAKKEVAGWDDPSNEVKSNWMKFNVSVKDDEKKADKIFGILINKRVVKSNLPGKEGEPVNVYEIRATEPTTYHVLDDNKKLVEDAVHINPGDIYSVSGTAVIDRQMQNIRKGQIIGMKFIEEQPAKVKGHNPAKIIKVYAPKAENGEPLMDHDFVATQSLETY